MSIGKYTWFEASVPMGTGQVGFTFESSRLTGVFKAPGVQSVADESRCVSDALAHPVGRPGLAELAVGKNRIVILTSDHTRPMPSRITMPLLVREIREVAPNADVSVLVATGSHRPTTPEELEERFDMDMLRDARVDVRVHDPDDSEQLVHMGTLPSGGELILSKTAMDADLLLAEGFIEPHFFAGFSGGRKSVFPGVAARSSVMANHCADLIAHPHARTGMLEDNPIHADMRVAAEMSGLAFILNVVLDNDHRVAAAFAGDPDRAHRNGCDWLSQRVRIRPGRADIVITGNGGHPLDRDIYQSVKSMTAAESCCKPGGVIIEVSRCVDGHGGEDFFKTFAQGDPDMAPLSDRPTPEDILTAIAKRPAGDTIQDQWQSQIFARVLAAHPVVFLSEAPPEMVRAMGMHPVSTPEEALRLADRLLDREGASIAVIPDGVSVIVEQG